MNERELYKLNKIRNERNKKNDTVAGRLLNYVVNSNRGDYSQSYLIQEAEAQELLDKVLSDTLIKEDPSNILSDDNITALKSSIVNSIYYPPKYPLDDEEMAFLLVNKENQSIRSIKVKNLFKKTQFSVAGFLKLASHVVFDIFSNIQISETDNSSIPFAFKIICCIIFTISSLIQGATINFDEKKCRILFELLNDEEGLLGINKNNFVNQMVNNYSDLFLNEQSVVDNLNELESLGCVGFKSNDDGESCVYIRESIICNSIQEQ